MKLEQNPYRGGARPFPGLDDIPAPSTNAARPREMLARCPRAGRTDLTEIRVPGVPAPVSVKDERGRMGLGSFKALGAAYVIACDAAVGRAQGQTYVTASAGNHGLSVAAGAQAFGARSIIYLAETVPAAFARRLEAEGAEVRIEGAEYQDSLDAAARAAEAPGAVLLSDGSWPGYTERPHLLMEGYLALMDEAIDQLDQPPTHIFLQAGVGGLAAPCAALARQAWGDAPLIVVTEPEAAQALAGSIRVGRVATTEGPISHMGRLDCKTPSLIALKGLARDADLFALITEEEGTAGAEAAAAAGMPSTTSGAAGLAALVAGAAALGLDARSRPLVILSERPEG